ncbi:M67 family metallopeptidase [Magnetospira thiophila]
MLILPPDLRRQIVREAEAAYPDECCGLLVGSKKPGGRVLVQQVVPTANVAEEDTHDRFEIDPRVHIRLLRELRGGPTTVVGHYHSHPDHPAQPSAQDLERAHDPALIWLIAAVAKGRVAALTAHRLDPEKATFRPLELHDWDAPDNA